MQAVMVGIEDFGCEVIHCFLDDLKDGLNRVTVSKERARKMEEEGLGRRRKENDEELRSGVEGGSRTFARMADVLEEVKRCKRQLERGWGRPLHAGSNSTARQVVDVLAVFDFVMLADYSDEAGAGPSAREVFLSVSVLHVASLAAELARAPHLGLHCSACGAAETTAVVSAYFLNRLARNIVCSHFVRSLDSVEWIPSQPVSYPPLHLFLHLNRAVPRPLFYSPHPPPHPPPPLPSSHPPYSGLAASVQKSS